MPTARSFKIVARTFAAGLLAAACSFSVVIAGESFPYAGEISASSVRLRSGPSINHATMKVLAQKDKLVVVESRDGWVKVRLPEDAPCWVSEQFVKDDGGNSNTGRVQGQNINLRATPNTDHGPIGQVTNCEIVFAVDDKGQRIKKDGWVKIVPPETAFGWVSADLIARTNDAVASAGKASPKVAGQSRKVEANSETADELKAFRELEISLVNELEKPMGERDLADIRGLYEQFAATATDKSIRERAQEQLGVIIRIEKKIEDARNKATAESKAASEAVAKAKAEKAKAVEDIISPRKDEGPVTYSHKGWVASHGRKARVPASHALVDADGKVIVFLRGNIDHMVGKYAGVTGIEKTHDGWDRPIVAVERCDEQLEPDAEDK